VRLSVALLLTIFTGFSGLVYEVTWQKYLAVLLGSHSEATSAVLAIFLGGLAVGYALFGRMTRSVARRAAASGGATRLLRTYAVIEGAIGVYALVFPGLFALARQLSLLIPGDYVAIGFGFDVALSAALIGPPAILMGGTIPILTHALTRDIEDATRIHAWVYGLNTFGAFAGALCAGFLLIPLLGLDSVLRWMAAINLMAAAGFAYLDYRGERSGVAEPGGSDASDSIASSAVQGSHVRGLIIVSALAGFAMMTLQTTLIRVGGLAMGSSVYTFAMVVAVFVLAIAIGSLAVSAFARIPAIVIVGSQWLLIGLLIVLYHYVPDAPYYAHEIRAYFRDQDASFVPYQFLILVSILALLIVPIGLSGALLPLLFHHLRRTVGELGSIAGRIYSWNTIGSLVGALFGGYLLLIWLDLHHVYRVALAAIGLGATILTVEILKLPRAGTLILVTIPLVGSLSLLQPWDPDKMASGLFRMRTPSEFTYHGADEFFARRDAGIIFHTDGPSSTVTIRQDQGKGQMKGKRKEILRSIATNGKADGHLVGDYPTMALAGLIPALLAEKAERSFVIGYGTGVTAGELGVLDEMREVHVAEISRAVIEAAPLFEAGNQAPLANPKVEVRRGDAYRSLMRATGTYDVIVSEPSNPWVTGVEMLFSREFLEAGHERLSPGGVYVQWFHQYEVNDEAVALVIRTFASVFPRISVWFTMGRDVLIMGFKDTYDQPGIDELNSRFGRPDYAAGFGRVGIMNMPELLAHELLPMGVVHSVELPGDLHTLSHPRLSHTAARGFFVGESAAMPSFVTPESVSVATQNSLLRRFVGRDLYSDRVLGSVANQACKNHRNDVCSSAIAVWKLHHPVSEKRDALLRRARQKQKMTRANALTDQQIGQLMRLYEPGARFERLTRPLPRARLFSNLYLEHFYYPIPFERDALRSVWRECDTTRCEAPRRDLERIVGPLDL